MNKNKKIVALICAMAMIFSMFASFTVVNAEEITKGIVLEYEASTRTANTAVVVAKAVGYTQVDSFTVNINVPDGVQESDVTVKDALLKGEAGLTDGVYGYSAGSTGAVDVPANGVLIKFEIKLPSTVTESFDVTLQDKSQIGVDTDILSTLRKNLPISTTTVEKYVDPSITPTPTPLEPTTTRAPKPTKAPVATEDPSATVVPTKAPVEVTKGIALETESVANGTAVIVAKAVGYTQVDSFTVNINVPDGVQESDVTVKDALLKGEAGLTDGVYGYSAGSTGAVDVPANGVLIKFEIKLPSTVTESFDVTLQDKSQIGVDTDILSTLRKNLPIAWTTVKISSAEPTPTAAPSVVGSVALNKLVSSDKVTGENVANNESDYRIGIVVTKNGAEAEYGTDFIAFYGDKELTEDEYVGLVNGYLDSIDGVTSLKDVIDNITFKTYNSGVKIYAELVNANNEVVDNSTVNADPTPTAKPTEPSISVKASSTTVEFDKKFTVTATVKNAKDGAKVAFTTNDDEKYAVIFGTPTEINSKGETKATYVANDKAGTVTITATYTDTEGNEKSASVKVTVKKASTTTGGNNGTTSGGGPGIIAPGNTGAVTTPNTNTNYKPDFQDLDSVEWARTAINGLAMRGMINGRDQYTFDPNANITRAEYCQILMGAINALNAKGESTFADVPSTAWYYNAVSVASQLGIVSGYGDGNFGPNDLITRQDMALMTYKTAKIMNKSLEPVNAEITFEDSHEISDYAFEAVMTLQKAGIINGMTDTTFEPHSNATRAQSAKVIFDTFVDAQ